MNSQLIFVLTVAAAMLAMSGCGGGGGSSASNGSEQATTINGITVPPEPESTQNNATRAGVDANNNGVRDDVERIVASKSSSLEANAKALAMAGVYQKILVSPTPTDRNEAIVLERERSCAMDMPGVLDSSLGVGGAARLSEVTANTADRLTALRNHYFALVSLDSEEVICK